jgi:hypothetical protein
MIENKDDFERLGLHASLPSEGAQTRANAILLVACRYNNHGTQRSIRESRGHKLSPCAMSRRPRS